MIVRELCRCTPVRPTRAASAVSALLMGGGLLLWLAAPMLPLTALWRAGAALLICAGLYAAVRFVFHGYTYTLAQHGDGRVDFTVVEQSGRRQVTVCRIDCDDISAVRTAARGEKLPRPSSALRVYHYCAAFRPAVLTVLEVQDGEVPSSIRILADDAFRAALIRLTEQKEILDGFRKTP